MHLMRILRLQINEQATILHLGDSAVEAYVHL